MELYPINRCKKFLKANEQMLLDIIGTKNLLFEEILGNSELAHDDNSPYFNIPQKWTSTLLGESFLILGTEKYIKFCKEVSENKLAAGSHFASSFGQVRLISMSVPYFESTYTAKVYFAVLDYFGALKRNSEVLTFKKNVLLNKWKLIKTENIDDVIDHVFNRGRNY